MDPISIAAGSATLLALSGKCVISLASLVQDAKNIDTTIQEFCSEVELTNDTIETLDHAIRSDSLRKLANTTGCEDLWVHISKAILKMRETLSQLDKLLEDIKKGPKFFRKPWSLLKANLKSGELRIVRQRMVILSNTIGLPLQMLNVFVQGERAISDQSGQVDLIARLSVLEQSILKVEALLTPSSKRSDVKTEPHHKHDSTVEINATDMLSTAKMYANSASINGSISSQLSSATVVQKNTQGLPKNSKPYAESEYGSIIGPIPLTQADRKLIHAWIPSPAVGETSDVASLRSALSERPNTTHLGPTPNVATSVAEPECKPEATTILSASTGIGSFGTLLRHIVSCKPVTPPTKGHGLELSILCKKVDLIRSLYRDQRFDELSNALREVIPMLEKEKIGGRNVPHGTYINLRVICGTIAFRTWDSKSALDILCPILDHKLLSEIEQAHIGRILAEIHVELQQYDKAKRLCLKIAPLIHEQYGEKHDMFQELAFLLCRIYMALQSKSEAELWKQYLEPYPSLTTSRWAQLERFVHQSQELNELSRQNPRGFDPQSVRQKAEQLFSSYVCKYNDVKVIDEIIAGIVAATCDGNALPLIRKSNTLPSHLYYISPHESSAGQCLHEIEYLIHHGMDLHGVWKDRQYDVNSDALQHTIWRKELEMVKMLVREGIDTKMGLKYSCTLGNLETVQFFLSQEVQINTIIDGVMSGPPIRKGYTALVGAASYLKVDIVELLLSHGADPNLSSPAGYTSLQAACENRANSVWDTEINRRGAIRIADLLIMRGANINRKEFTFIEGTPLRCSLFWNDDLFSFLLEKGADPNCGDLRPLTGAAGLNSETALAKVKLLVEKGADINSADSTSPCDTPLHTAARTGIAETADYLLSQQAKVDEKNTYDQTPLHVAFAAYRNPESSADEKDRRLRVIAVLLAHSNKHRISTAFDEVCSEFVRKLSEVDYENLQLRFGPVLKLKIEKLRSSRGAG